MLRKYINTCCKDNEEFEEFCRHLVYDLRFDILSRVIHPSKKGNVIYEIDVDTDGYIGETPIIPPILCGSAS